MQSTQADVLILGFGGRCQVASIVATKKDLRELAKTATARGKPAQNLSTFMVRRATRCCQAGKLMI